MGEMEKNVLIAVEQSKKSLLEAEVPISAPSVKNSIPQLALHF